MKTISSAQTFMMKIVFPVLWISGFGFSTITLWLTSILDKNGSPPPQDMKWQFLGAFIIGTLFILWSCYRLKQVRIDSSHLYVSNYSKEISIPLNQITNITENRWINTHPITIYFSDPTEFGQSITFMPTMRLFGFSSSHPVVAEIKRLIKSNRP